MYVSLKLQSMDILVDNTVFISLIKCRLISDPI